MVKKRLSDLLREEVQKSTEAEETEVPADAGETADETAEAKPSSSPSGRSPRSRSTTASKASTDDSTTSATEPPEPTPDPEDSLESASEPEPDSEQAGESEPQPISATTEQAIADLKAALAAAQHREEALQQQVVSLQSELDDQVAIAQHLQSELVRANQYKAELEKARGVIVQLSEATTQMTQELNQLKQQSPSSASPKPPIAQPSTSGFSNIQPRREQTQHQRELQKILRHPIQVEPMKTLSDEEIGWVD